MIICNTLRICVSTIADVMHPSFGMIPQGTTMQVLESNTYCGTWLIHGTVWSNFVIGKTSKQLGNRYWLYVIPYVSAYIQLLIWCILPSFGMVPQGTTIQVLESTTYCGTWLIHGPVWSNFCIANTSKILAKGIWLYAIPYVSAYLQLLM